MRRRSNKLSNGTATKDKLILLQVAIVVIVVIVVMNRIVVIEELRDRARAFQSIAQEGISIKFVVEALVE